MVLKDLFFIGTPQPQSLPSQLLAHLLRLLDLARHSPKHMTVTSGRSLSTHWATCSPARVTTTRRASGHASGQVMRQATSLVEARSLQLRQMEETEGKAMMTTTWLCQVSRIWARVLCKAVPHLGLVSGGGRMRNSSNRLLHLMGVACQDLQTTWILRRI